MPGIGGRTGVNFDNGMHRVGAVGEWGAEFRWTPYERKQKVGDGEVFRQQLLGRGVPGVRSEGSQWLFDT